MGPVVDDATAQRARSRAAFHARGAMGLVGGGGEREGKQLLFGGIELNIHWAQDWGLYGF